MDAATRADADRAGACIDVGGSGVPGRIGEPVDSQILLNCAKR
jgi:hypothetical protein